MVYKKWDTEEQRLAARKITVAKYNAKSKSRQTLWQERNREKVQASKRRQRRRERGQINEPTRPMPLICECCLGPPQKHGLVEDHDHSTGLFRGWLCGNCNSAIGKLGDNLEGVQRAVVYLSNLK